MSRTMDEAEHEALARKVVAENENLVVPLMADLKRGKWRGVEGKVQSFVGKMMRAGDGRCVPGRARTAVRRVLGLDGDGNGDGVGEGSGDGGKNA